MSTKIHLNFIFFQRITMQCKFFVVLETIFLHPTHTCFAPGFAIRRNNLYFSERKSSLFSQIHMFYATVYNCQTHRKKMKRLFMIII